MIMVTPFNNWAAASQVRGDLAYRWLISMPANRKFRVTVPHHTDVEETINKLRNLTSGNFFISGWTVYFIDEKDYVAFKLGIG